MDLLNDYSSSDDGDEEDTSDPISRIDHGKLRSAEPQQNSKVLKLASVLPPEILEQLARGDDDSSSDDDDQPVRNIGKSSGALSFLNNLHSVKPKHSSPFPVNAFADIETANTKPPSNSQPPTSQPSKPPSPEEVKATEMVTEFRAESKGNRIRAAPSTVSIPLISQQVAQPSLPNSSIPTPDPSNTTALNPRKRRQKIERALRNGELSAVTPSSQASTVVGDSSAVHLVDYDAAQTIRQVPAGVYDPSTGKLSAAGKRGAGKNQVHFLVHQAAALERQRAEQLGSSNNTNRRADSKRKYGW